MVNQNDVGIRGVKCFVTTDERVGTWRLALIWPTSIAERRKYTNGRIKMNNPFEERGYSAIGMYNPKDPINYGNTMRAAGCFSVSLVVTEGKRFKQMPQDTQSSWKHIPVVEGMLMDCNPYGAVPVAVEIRDDARCLTTFQHPERAYYVFGPEDGSLPNRIVDRCSAIVTIPTVQCLNLNAAICILLYDRLMKQRP